ncbi:odv-ec27 [Cyclophragma undans nucleopolyhedrovirus]|uniref:Odv-ec27 n=1 Tax=Cyclophragma undans nucleopolyhedrovirus TaxID=1906244 RepID=A0A288QCY8_9ABAC|nr:odv-ec27 [Cyclophragma undans nucleopolyhedrovirus]AOT85483.1 odv-ec27 [Cyclophragma undans nucleopolyhedrovirus]
MKRVNCNKIRTVTEIINKDEKIQKNYDLSEFDVKNLNSLESYEDLKIKLVIVKYIAMINTLQLTQPLLEVFKNKADTQQIAAVILSTLGFIHNRFNPLVTHFNNKMEFVITETNDTSIPGEPILFTENDGVVLCAVDRPSIVKMLNREFDFETSIDFGQENNSIRIAKTLGAGGGLSGGGAARKKRFAMNSISSSSSSNKYSSYYNSDVIYNRRCDEYNRPLDEMDLNDFNVTETEVTQYLTMLLIMEHAYLHYYIFKNYGVFEYSQSLVDHSLFTNKLRSSLNTKTFNLLLSKFKFTIEDFDKINSNSIVSGFNIFKF